MLFCEVNFAVRWLGLAAMVTLGLSAAAQQTIQFTKPVETDPASKANAFLPETPRRDPASFNAPAPLFGSRGPTADFDVLPGSPPPAYPAANAAQWRKFLDNKKNWTLMTPEEILGIPAPETPEKILGVTSPYDDPSVSPEERFLMRYDQQAAMTATNGLNRAGALSWFKDDPTAGPFQIRGEDSHFAETLDGSVPGSSRIRNSVFDQRSDQQANVNQKSDSTWISPFDLPEPLPKPTPDQLAGMERFRALFEPPPQDKASPISPFSVQPVLAPDPNMQPLPTSFNPAGRSVAPLQSDIAYPTGLAPLAGITGPLPVAKKPAPLVQPPPWMQDSLQNPTMPQRQF